MPFEHLLTRLSDSNLTDVLGARLMTNSINDVNPTDAWDGLKNASDAVLIDVRTRVEWSFIGVPDLSELGMQPMLVEWKMSHNMQVNDNFAQEVLEHLDGAAPSKAYFLCRSGARSLEAAHLMSQVFEANGQTVECINVAEGFEGDLDSFSHRGVINGWKARGLAWRQS